MIIQADWREIVKKINGTSSTIGWNSAEGLGMSGFEFVTGGDNTMGGAVCWKAGNRLLVINSIQDGTSLLEMREYLPGNDPADLAALDTWNRLVELVIRNEPIEVTTIDKLSSNKRPGRPSYPEDEWAWIEVNKRGRDKSIVYKEWLMKLETTSRRNNIDKKRQFNRVIETDWFKGQY